MVQTASVSMTMRFVCVINTSPPKGDGDCSTKYKGKFWCYLHELSACSDAMPSRRKPGTYWSWKACPKIPTRGTLTRNPELGTDNFYFNGTEKVYYEYSHVCGGGASRNGKPLTHSSGTVGTSFLNQDKKECKCS